MREIGGSERERRGEGRGAEGKAQGRGKKRKREERWTCPLTVDSLRSHSPPLSSLRRPRWRTARERPGNGRGASEMRRDASTPSLLDGRGQVLVAFRVCAVAPHMSRSGLSSAGSSVDESQLFLLSVLEESLCLIFFTTFVIVPPRRRYVGVIGFVFRLWSPSS